MRVAQQSAVPLSVVNPRQVRDFARGVGRLAKSDPIDAEMLARFGAAVNPPPDAVPTAAELALQELLSARQQLVEQRTVLLQQQAQHLNSIVRRLDRARLKLLQRQIAQLELDIGSILEEQSVLKQKVERLQQVKGVGLITAVTCVAGCPERGSRCRGQTAALVAWLAITMTAERVKAGDISTAADTGYAVRCTWPPSAPSAQTQSCDAFTSNCVSATNHPKSPWSPSSENSLSS